MSRPNLREAEGIAFGDSNIRNDTIVFRFRDEVFELPSMQAVKIATHNGYFYEAHIDDLRALSKTLGERNG